jgi:hypothetical protein
MRELIVGDTRIVVDHDLYGDQAYFEHPRARRMAAGNDVECGIRIWKDGEELHLAFEGQLRGFNRFALQRPPLWYRNEYVFTDAPRFTQTWSFRTEKSFREKQAFLASVMELPTAERFRFLRDGGVMAEGAVGAAGGRQGETAGQAPPDRMEFLSPQGPELSLKLTGVPEGYRGNVFVHGPRFYVTLLDGAGAAMEAGRWYSFTAEWHPGTRQE